MDRLKYDFKTTNEKISKCITDLEKGETNFWTGYVQGQIFGIDLYGFYYGVDKDEIIELDQKLTTLHEILKFSLENCIKAQDDLKSLIAKVQKVEA